MEKEKKQSKCNIHPNLNNNFLLFEEDNIHTKICFKCAKEQTEFNDKIIDQDEFLHADQNYIFSGFPPLEDKKIYKIIQNLQIQKDNSIQEMFVEKINDYFINLKKQINQKIDLLHNQVKQKLIQMEDLDKNQRDTFLDIYNEISSKFDIQQLLKEQQQDSEQRLKEIIQQKYQNIKENTDKLQKRIAEYSNTITKIDFIIPNLIQQKLLNLIDGIDFFSKDIDNVDFEKSKSYGSSQNLQIQRLQNGQIQITQSIDNHHGVSYANFILDPNQKYYQRTRQRQQRIIQYNMLQ
ncbi:hypothetical protein TTHERM_000423321 (macronuclear) [Tetrahymena thermophila SB210]|uniref:Kinase domain protein n=1 Tax=Tetrahymena thermophila (strain SB210) TaxID=312017 RepID=W7XC45_TETTS|nr:hypothetical protein TTHERM_000423321 [Tetrahymena thermophila SB210]EWS74952.1 hypothetical protein TTHERM_000423321 [Tetrahymena thermophila SB210]|eukprot:XP_012652493.1 hypothetical protein TTHERM_000423321 [Tetrahymena thermophila SB210]